jgi:hypothetical protein
MNLNSGRISHMTYHRTPRRGMVLLIVLGMLALFSLLAVTYVVFSSQSRQSSVVLANSDYRGTNNATLMNQVVKQVLRGTDEEVGIVGTRRSRRFARPVG